MVLVFHLRNLLLTLHILTQVRSSMLPGLLSVVDNSHVIDRISHFVKELFISIEELPSKSVLVIFSELICLVYFLG